MPHYTAFGFVIESDLIFPELEQATGEIDIVIKQKKISIPSNWSENKGIRTIASLSSIIVGVSNILILEIIEGKYIHYQPQEAFIEGKARLYILGLAFSAIIHQRGLLPLHASSLVKEGKAVLICGESGAGKSTTAAALLQHGFELLSDDISLIQLDAKGEVEVLPGFPHLKLWPESAELLQVDENELTSFSSDILKKGWRLKHSYYQQSAKISMVCFLSKQDSSFSLVEVDGINKVKMLIDNTFRIRYVSDTGQHQAFFTTTSKLASSVKFYSIIRPLNQNSIRDVVDLIMSQLTKL